MTKWRKILAVEEIFVNLRAVMIPTNQHIAITINQAMMLSAMMMRMCR
jgi:hypothetical protein